MKIPVPGVTAFILVLLSLGLLVIPLAPLAGAETLGTWNATTNYPSSVQGNSCVGSGGYIYCVGAGFGTNAVYYAPLSASGIGAWTATTSYPTNIYFPSCVTASSIVYCVGGYAGSAGPSDGVYYATLSASGVGAWTATTDYPTNIEATSCTLASGYVVCVGGLLDTFSDITDAVYYAAVSASGVGAWTRTTNYPLQGGWLGIQSTSCVAIGGGAEITCVGGMYDATQEYLTNAVYYDSFTGSGLGGSWTATTDYPTLISFEPCIYMAGYIDCNGGYSNQAGVNYGADTTGAVTSWTATTSYPLPPNSLQCVVAGFMSNEYMYCVGGDTNLTYYSEMGGAMTTTTTAVSCIPASFAVGGGSTCTATVTGSSPTGTVTFTQAGAGSVTFSAGGVCTLSAGSCFVTATGATAGAVTITGTYGGDGSNSGSLGNDPVTVTSGAPPPPPPTPVCPSTAGGVLMPPGATFTDLFGNTWVAPSGSLGGGVWSSYFFSGPESVLPPPMLSGWGGVYGTYGGVMGWIITFYC